MLNTNGESITVYFAFICLNTTRKYSKLLLSALFNSMHKCTALQTAAQDFEKLGTHLREIIATRNYDLENYVQKFNCTSS